MPEPLVMCWSGGKDSALALRELLPRDDVEVVALLTTVTAGYDRISMHGVRRSLLAEQAAALELPLREVAISPAATNAEYEERMGAALAEFHHASVKTVAFGDIFLADLREYRERQLARLGMRAVFPLWRRDTSELIETFQRDGFRAVTCCVDPRRLDASFVGREIDAEFVRRLPAGVDPCGENGEFHSFVYDGPIFRRPVAARAGEVVQRDSFLFCDLLSDKAPEAGGGPCAAPAPATARHGVT